MGQGSGSPTASPDLRPHLDPDSRRILATKAYLSRPLLPDWVDLDLGAWQWGHVPGRPRRPRTCGARREEDAVGLRALRQPRHGLPGRRRLPGRHGQPEPLQDPRQEQEEAVPGQRVAQTPPLAKAEIDESLVRLDLAPRVEEALGPEHVGVLPVLLVVVDRVGVDEHHGALGNVVTGERGVPERAPGPRDGHHVVQAHHLHDDGLDVGKLLSVGEGRQTPLLHVVVDVLEALGLDVRVQHHQHQREVERVAGGVRSRQEHVQAHHHELLIREGGLDAVALVSLDLVQVGVDEVPGAALRVAGVVRRDRLLQQLLEGGVESGEQVVAGALRGEVPQPGQGAEHAARHVEGLATLAHEVQQPLQLGVAVREPRARRQRPQHVEHGGRQQRAQGHRRGLLGRGLQLVEQVLELGQDELLHVHLAVAQLPEVAHGEAPLLRPERPVRRRDAFPRPHGAQPHEEVVRPAQEHVRREHLGDGLVAGRHDHQVTAQAQPQHGRAVLLAQGLEGGVL